MTKLAVLMKNASMWCMCMYVYVCKYVYVYVCMSVCMNSLRKRTRLEKTSDGKMQKRHW